MDQDTSNTPATLPPQKKWFEYLGKPPYYRHEPVDLSVLTPREKEVFEFLARGLNLPETAANLRGGQGKPLSRNTTAQHEASLYEKLAISNRAELVKAAIAAGTLKVASGQMLDDLIRTYKTLTGREREVLEQVALGQTNAQAGTALGLSKHTINEYKKAIYKKFGIDNSADATLRYVTLKMEADRLMQQKILEQEDPASADKKKRTVDDETVERLKAALASTIGAVADSTITFAERLKGPEDNGVSGSSVHDKKLGNPIARATELGSIPLKQWRDRMEETQLLSDSCTYKSKEIRR